MAEVGFEVTIALYVMAFIFTYLIPQRNTNKIVGRIDQLTHEISRVTLAGFLAINTATRGQREVIREDLQKAFNVVDEILALLSRRST